MLTDKIKMTLFDPGEIKFYDLPMMTTDFIQFGYAEEKKGNDLNLSIAVIYTMKNALNSEDREVEVARAHTKYFLKTDGMLSIGDLYSCCETSVNMLKNHINSLAKIKGKPPVNISAPPVENLKESLQPILNLFLSAGN
jgi:hypothetical protein